jgi:hypothetical protein
LGISWPGSIIGTPRHGRREIDMGGLHDCDRVSRQVNQTARVPVVIDR